MDNRGILLILGEETCPVMAKVLVSHRRINYRRYCLKKFLFILIYYSVSAFGFSPKTINLFESSTKDYSHLKNPGLVTFWGGIRRTLMNESTKGNLLKYKNQKYIEAEFTYYQYQTAKNKTLTVFFPGVFGEVDGLITPGMINLLEGFSTDVLVIPNFLALNYIESKPKYKKFNENLDLIIALDILNKVLKEKDYQKLNITAESLGTMVAAGVIKDIEFSNKIDGLLMWPPLEIKTAIDNFDNGIENTLTTYNECGVIFNSLKIIKYFIWDEIPKGMDLEFISCMNSYMYHFAFVKPIQKNFKKYAQISHKSFKELPKNFHSFFKSYNPSYYDQIIKKPNSFKLSYWLKERELKNTRIQVITSSNDFLNRGLDWNLFLKEAKITEKNLYIFKWGSHSGPLGINIWKEVFNNELFNEI